jgi:hypothetical protein
VQKFTILDGTAAVDFLLDGVLAGTGKLHKTGLGSLRLVGVNTAFPGGVRLGSAGLVSVQEAGGRLIIGDKNALGTATPLDFQFNDGTLESEAVLTGANALPVGVSFGAGQLGPGTFAGQPMEFLGDLALFRPQSNTYEHKLQLETNVTFRGFAASQSTGTSTGLLITGTSARTLTFAGTAATASTEMINLDGPTLVVNGAMTGATVNVRAGTLRGPGPLGGILTIGDGVNENDAILEPGTGLGTLTLGGMFLLSDARVRLELDLTARTNDKLMADGPIDLGMGIASVEFIFLNATTVPLGTIFTLIDNTPFGTTSGAFDGLPDGAVFSFAGNQFQIDYTAGPDLNDVILSAIPEPVRRRSCWLLAHWARQPRGVGGMSQPGKKLRGAQRIAWQDSARCLKNLLVRWAAKESRPAGCEFPPRADSQEKRLERTTTGKKQHAQTIHPSRAPHSLRRTSPPLFSRSAPAHSPWRLRLPMATSSSIEWAMACRRCRPTLPLPSSMNTRRPVRWCRASRCRRRLPARTGV